MNGFALGFGLKRRETREKGYLVQIITYLIDAMDEQAKWHKQ